MAVYITHSKEETMALARQLSKQLQNGGLIAFTGGLGAGKTAFCTGLAEGLGCTDEVQSPTFSIVNVYRGKITFAHFDMYRISTEEDLYAASFYDYLDSGAVVAAEWSENIAQFLEEPYIKINIEVLGENDRKLTIEGAAPLEETPDAAQNGLA
ncbi:MAG: tRNA (adenosine(37)-N6)-threonylcarbamoyltransferase complex ATPase subunit type 1 TsaE [Pygmaiobacter massiliensis]|uniref:tRNA (adenosine(37)-N6)-threonylcarbamoyltransferase complex ATPase subunit type 1 TsaE n=1 Tax=Pygmaiobacter massiliensis TaxID=1917873 RepID=UPI000C7BB8EC|nr:tRNA (adenosine(37)-N6)-threonylcarbamoyltransferase complex ATPase subunit type 1 TsaE [Pygmaiobacter massiliensis]